MTEAGSVVLLSGDESDQPESRRGSFGKPAPGFETMILARTPRESASCASAGHT